MKISTLALCGILVVASILLFEIIPSSGIWSIVIMKRQGSGRIPVYYSPIVLSMGGGSRNINGKLTHSPQEDAHTISVVKYSINRSSKFSDMIFSYPKPEDEHVICVVTTTTTTVAGRSASFRTNDDETSPVKGKERLVHQAFRIDENALRRLQKEAAKKGVSVSNLVNTIIKGYVTDGIYFEQQGFIPVSKDFLRTIFGRIEKEQDIGDYSRNFGNLVVSEYASNFFPKLNSETLVQFLELWFRRFHNYQHRIEKVNNNNPRSDLHTFSITHDINVNFSIVLKRILPGLIEPLTRSIVMFSEVAPSSLTFSFEVK